MNNKKTHEIAKSFYIRNFLKDIKLVQKNLTSAKVFARKDNRETDVKQQHALYNLVSKTKKKLTTTQKVNTEDMR